SENLPSSSLPLVIPRCCYRILLQREIRSERRAYIQVPLESIPGLAVNRKKNLLNLRVVVAYGVDYRVCGINLAVAPGRERIKKLLGKIHPGSNSVKLYTVEHSCQR